MFHFVRSLKANSRLLKEFIVRDLKARYVGSSMGFFWSVVFPIINLMVFMFVFQLVLKARWGDTQGPTEVALVMLAGIVIWAAFAETVSRATNCLVENSNLIQKVVFPSEVLPVYLTVSSIINMCIGLPVVILCVSWFAFFSQPATGFNLTEDRVETPVHRTIGENLVVSELDPESPPQSNAVAIVVDRAFRKDTLIGIEFKGQATLGEDYTVEPATAAEGYVVVPAGEKGIELYITPKKDEDIEGDETLTINLVEPTDELTSDVGTGGVGQYNEFRLMIIDGARSQAVRPPRYGVEGSEVAATLDLSSSLLALPVLFLLQIMFTAGLGCFLATLNLFLRDTFHLVGVLITVWMFATPIFYPANLVIKAGFGWLLLINPMHWLIDSYRVVLLYGEWPSVSLLVRMAVISLVALYFGSRFFMAQKHRFPDLL